MLEVTGKDSPPQSLPCRQLRTALPRMRQSQQEGSPGPGQPELTTLFVVTTRGH